MEDHTGTCRVCGQNGLKLILSLGHTPLANRLLTEQQLAESEPTYPLDLAFCDICSLVQITEAPAAAELFDEYVYFSSYSDTMLEHAAVLAKQMIKVRRLGCQDLVIEVGSNDGYLLQNYNRAGIKVLGVEPAKNVARVANEQHRFPTRCAYFTRQFADQPMRLFVQDFSDRDRRFTFFAEAFFLVPQELLEICQGPEHVPPAHRGAARKHLQLG